MAHPVANTRRGASEDSLNVEAAAPNEQAPAQSVVVDDLFLARLAELEARLALRRPEIATITGTRADRLTRGAPLSDDVRCRTDSLARIADRVAEFFVEDAVRDWLTEPNHAMLGAIPLDRLRAGHCDEIDAALTALDYGIYV